jgi:transglutaminase-like putative cysteine protease
MARLLGIPARMVNGFSQGTYNTQQKAWIVNGSDAHSWVQVYFPGYGWMNFDPTPGFSVNSAGSPAPSPSPTATKAPPSKSPTATPSQQPTPKVQATATPRHAGGSPTTPGSTDPGSGISALLGISLLVLFTSCLILAFAVVRYRKVRSAAQGAVTSVYQRLCRVASLLGSPPAAWQTPYEYTFALSKRFPQASASLRRLADLFVRERWASPKQAPAPAEQQELERLWPDLRNTLLRSRISKGR